MLKTLLGIVTLIILLINFGCVPKGGFKPSSAGAGCIYTFGDASYDDQLHRGVYPSKFGVIVKENVPASFPQKFLEPDGSYAGAHVYSSIQAAELGILQAQRENKISADSVWGIYELQGNWQEDTYQFAPNDFRLKKTIYVKRKVK